jgi:hypothetical protein
MSALAWTIYLISGLDALRSTFSGIEEVFIIAGIVVGIVIFFNTATGESIVSKKDQHTAAKAWSLYRLVFFKIGIPVVIASMIIGIVVPSRSTMIMIASAEVGDRVFKDRNVGAEILDPSVELLKTWIQTELKSQKALLEKEKNALLKDAEKKTAAELENTTKELVAKAPIAAREAAKKAAGEAYRRVLEAQ